METTMKNNQIIPEVIADLVDSRLGDKLSLMPLARVDDTLQGMPGDTLKFPAFRYIGKADQVDENGQVQAGVLSADTVSATVKKYAKAVRLTDEARLSGFGDPVGEAAKQLAHSIDHAVDSALYDVLMDAGLGRKVPIAGMSSDAVVDALTLFGEEQEGDKVLLTDAEGFAALRKDPGYIRGGDLGQQMVFSGAVGQIWGCQIVISARVKNDPVRGEKQHFILKPGALCLVNKTGTQVEVSREPEYMRDTIYCSKHCAAYLYDAGKLVSLTQFTGLETLGAACGIASVAGGAGKTRVVIPDALAAPQGYKWVVLMDDNPQFAGGFGTAVTGTKDWTGNEAELTTGGKMTAHVLLVGTQDMKPVKAFSTLVMAG